MESERQFLHQISNDIAPASVLLEIALEEMESDGRLESSLSEQVRSALVALKNLMKHIEERRSLIQAPVSNSTK